MGHYELLLLDNHFTLLLLSEHCSQSQYYQKTYAPLPCFVLGGTNPGCVPITIFFRKLAYAPFVSGVWCYMEIYRNMPPFAKDDIIAAILQLPELISFMLLVVVFGNFTNKR